MSKSKPEALLGLSMNDARLILLANYIAGEPKVRTPLNIPPRKDDF